jgi:hypothetical protein
MLPAPAVDGLNVVPVTPEPEKFPPAGLPPVNVTGDAFEHILANDPNDTEGAELTTWFAEAVEIHPCAFV